MKYFKGRVSVPYLTFLGYEDKGSAANGTVECDGLVVAPTKKRAAELLGTTPYWLNKMWKQRSAVPDISEGVWWRDGEKSEYKEYV
jgi:hypothetical protein